MATKETVSSTKKGVSLKVTQNVGKGITNKSTKAVSGFSDFIRGQGVMGIAIGLVIGTQVKDTVNQAVTSFVNPLLGLLLPGSGNLATEGFRLHFHHRQALFSYGAFVSSLITFLAVALIVYFTIVFLRLDKLDKKKTA
jgi:large conductance mechanosensitive channel